MYPIVRPKIGFDDFISAINIFEKDSVSKFEAKFAKYSKRKYAIVFPYARSAIYSIFMGLNIKNKNILIPAYTCIVVPNVIVLSKNNPIFLDSKKGKINLDVKDINSTLKTKDIDVLILTHMFGEKEDISNIITLKNKKIMIIEDSCLSLDFTSKINDTKSDISIYSFNMSKQMTTFDGGMLVTDNYEYYLKIKKFRDLNFHKTLISKKIKILSQVLITNIIYNKFIYGVLNKLSNSFMFLKKRTQNTNWSVSKIDVPNDYLEKYSQIQARIGLNQLDKLIIFNNKKIQIVKWYEKYLKLSNSQKTLYEPNRTYTHYNIFVKDRNKLIKYLYSNGIKVGLALDYTVPLTLAYKKYRINNAYSNSQKIAEEIINLPFYFDLTEKDIRKVCNVLNSYYQKND